MKKYIVASYKDNGELVGYLNYFDSSTRNYTLDKTNVIFWHKKEDCVASDGERWLKIETTESGYYKIEEIEIEQPIINPCPLDEQLGELHTLLANCYHEFEKVSAFYEVQGILPLSVSHYRERTIPELKRFAELVSKKYHELKR